MPNDPALHEFRALALFALGRYDEAAAALYAVLSVGPGWDWSTMISLYGNPDAYTQQLRALENNVTQNANSAANRFVLAYHYLTQGHMNEAADQLKAVVSLQPKDQLSAQLLQQIQQKDGSPASGNPANNPPGPAPASGASPPTENPPGPWPPRAGATAAGGGVRPGRRRRVHPTPRRPARKEASRGPGSPNPRRTRPSR